jgi:RND family efflux transporter MFP subunit
MKQLLLLAGLCGLLDYTACTSRHEEKETCALKMDTSIINEYVSQIRAIRHIELRAQERGYLQQIFVDEGQFVKEGQLLFRIMPRIYEAELQRAQAEARMAEIEYQNTKGLTDNNVVSANELAMAKARLDKARAEQSLAQAHLQFTEIRAPFDGIIDRFYLKLGSLVDEGDLLSTLSDNSRMWVYFNVPEPEYLDYQMRAQSGGLREVHLRMANNQVFKYPGVVDAIEADFNNETGNIAFRASFPNPDKLLRHGQTGNILMKETMQDAVVIPQKATLEIMDKKYVYVVDKDSIVRLRPIVIGAEMPDLYIVREGLVANERILLEGLRKVKNKDRISFDYEAPRTVMAQLKLPTE